ncbi:hypothetical protein BFC19_01070 [Brochothrix thermosphacta]|uniref:restriction endonuclease subunit S n=1 Tax=Brochothrix thermosphacta TaxID=2756 RepID=UPI000E770C83|nr:restriction endonuclease subunit S [Brochothrix thermosphacta]ANZ94119.1 hypothetical protein BFC19_01070 [Brochothrix thermosphacta]
MNRQPKIRFSEFHDTWKESKLYEITEKVTEKNKNNIYSETLTNSAEFGIINQRDFFDKDISNEKNLNGYYVVQPDDFVYNPRISNFAPVGPIKRNNLGRTGVMSPLYYVFRVNNINKTYLETYFSSSYWHIFMKLNGDSGARSDRFAIKDSIFREMPIPTPPLEEQSKIGDFFKQLDDTIALQQQELDTLKQTKQGFLKKMFPKEGETVPEVRFEGFSGTWEEQKIENLVTSLDYGLNASAKSFDGENKYIRITDIDESSHKFIQSSLTSPDINLENANDYLLDEGDILFTRTGASVGKTYCYNLIDGKVYYAGFLIRARLKAEYDSYFVFQNTLTNKYNKFIKITSQRSGQPGVNAQEYGCFQLLLPSFEEQSKIGLFFKQLDDTIALHQQELAALKETKQAFLQKMFV